MKNKKVINGGLLVIVCMIWGSIAFNIYNDLNPEKSNSAVRNKDIRKIGGDHMADTFSLLTNYPDPFLKGLTSTAPMPKPDAVKNKIKPAAVSAKAEKVDLGFIQYNGLISNSKGKKRVALISSKGIDKLVSEGEMADDITFVSFFSDSMKIRYQKKNYYIKRQK